MRPSLNPLEPARAALPDGTPVNGVAGLTGEGAPVATGEGSFLASDLRTSGDVDLTLFSAFGTLLEAST